MTGGSHNVGHAIGTGDTVLEESQNIACDMHIETTAGDEPLNDVTTYATVTVVAMPVNEVAVTVCDMPVTGVTTVMMEHMLT